MHITDNILLIAFFATIAIGAILNTFRYKQFPDYPKAKTIIRSLFNWMSLKSLLNILFHGERYFALTNYLSNSAIYLLMVIFATPITALIMLFFSSATQAIFLKLLIFFSAVAVFLSFVKGLFGFLLNDRSFPYSQILKELRHATTTRDDPRQKPVRYQSASVARICLIALIFLITGIVLICASNRILESNFIAENPFLSLALSMLFLTLIAICLKRSKGESLFIDPSLKEIDLSNFELLLIEHSGIHDCRKTIVEYCSKNKIRSLCTEISESSDHSITSTIRNGVNYLNINKNFILNNSDNITAINFAILHELAHLKHKDQINTRKRKLLCARILIGIIIISCILVSYFAPCFPNISLQISVFFLFSTALIGWLILPIFGTQSYWNCLAELKADNSAAGALNLPRESIESLFDTIHIQEHRTHDPSLEIMQNSIKDVQTGLYLVTHPLLALRKVAASHPWSKRTALHLALWLRSESGKHRIKLQ